jgi:3-deoxy-D-manno-octulosonic-acid transferase
MERQLSGLERLALGAYRTLTWLLQPWVRRKLRRRARQEPQYASQVDQRFGRYEGDASSGWCWIHAVSLGETRAAALLIDRWRAVNPSGRLLLTHGTATGWEAGQALLRPGDRQVWLPWDTASATQAFLDHFRPGLGVIMETEVWPNLMAACRAAGVPMVLANARLNQKSYAQGRRLRWLSRPAYQAFQAVWAQTADDAERLQGLGARTVEVLGNIKQDARPEPRALALGQRWRSQQDRPVLMLASSREGEEALWLKALEAVRERRSEPPLVQWLVVPRHPQRFDEVARLIEAAGWKVSRRSQWVEAPPEHEDPVIWLGDSLGEMAAYYSLCDVALLGGSFEPLGGQNLLEAAACGCPVVMGPHTFNFAQAAAQSLAAGSARRVATMEEAVTAALGWAQQPQEHEAARARALALTQADSKVAADMARRMNALLLAQQAPGLSAATGR